MHKVIGEKRSVNHLKDGRLLARVLAEDLRRVGGQELGSPVESVMTGVVRRDWSESDDDGVWLPPPT